MFLFIFESVGTSELIMIGAVALIIFGPRKLPQLAKTLGKTIADFKNTTNEFKTTWEREVSFEESSSIADTAVSPTVNRKPELFASTTEIEKNAAAPEIKEIDAAQFNLQPETIKPEIVNHAENQISDRKIPDKINWL